MRTYSFFAVVLVTIKVALCAPFEPKSVDVMSSEKVWFRYLRVMLLVVGIFVSPATSALSPCFVLCVVAALSPHDTLLDSRSTSLIKRQLQFTWPLPLPAILLTTTVIGSPDVILSTTLLTNTLSAPSKTEAATSTHSTSLVTSSTTVQTTHIVTLTTSQTTHIVTLPTTSVTSTTAIVDSTSTTLTTTTTYTPTMLSTETSYATVVLYSEGTVTITVTEGTATLFVTETTTTSTSTSITEAIPTSTTTA
ncbi:hypothetical protein M422DRAFT_244001 [Sphaerobolus stellatus SS14]|nr:hypothetical protein M422DRAFT_244001 [Sphaerobolus stellatus SS14]